MIAHLASSIGVKVWMLHGNYPPTRWGFQKKTPWYPYMRIFHYQESWKKTLEIVKKELESQFYEY